MELTLRQLKQFIPNNQYVEYWHETLYQLLPEYEINTAQRIAAFIAQCSHESNQFIAIKENLNYRPATLLKVFHKYFPSDEIANDYCSRPNKQQAIANRVYANRMGNGSEESGDGYKYCGRGLIQLTGKDNYTWFASSLNITSDEASEYLLTFEGAAQSACWFWETNNLNELADKNDIVAMTKRINGGLIGLEDRIKKYEYALSMY